MPFLHVVFRTASTAEMHSPYACSRTDAVGGLGAVLLRFGIDCAMFTMSR